MSAASAAPAEGPGRQEQPPRRAATGSADAGGPAAPGEPGPGTRAGRREPPWTSRVRRLAARPATPPVLRWLLQLRALLGRDTTPLTLTDAWRATQTPVPTGRRVLVVGAVGGVGTTTVAVCLLHALRAHRRDGVALVEGGDVRGGLITRTSETPVGDVRSARQAIEELLRREQWHSLLLAPGSPDPADAIAVATEIRRRVAFTLVDAGVGLRPFTRHSDLVVVVTDDTVRGVQAAEACRRLALVDGLPAERVLTVLSETSRGSGLPAPRAAADLESLGHRVLRLPWDRHLAGAVPVSADLLARRTLLALAELAGAVVRGAAPGGGRR